VQAVEIGNAVEDEQHRLAVDRELALPSPARRLDDPAIAIGPSCSRFG